MTCRKAERGESITNNAFKIASKVIRVEVPELEDMQLLKWQEDVIQNGLHAT